MGWVLFWKEKYAKFLNWTWWFRRTVMKWDVRFENETFEDEEVPVGEVDLPRVKLCQVVLDEVVGRHGPRLDARTRRKRHLYQFVRVSGLANVEQRVAAARARPPGRLPARLLQPGLLVSAELVVVHLGRQLPSRVLRPCHVTVVVYEPYQLHLFLSRLVGVGHFGGRDRGGHEGVCARFVVWERDRASTRRRRRVVRRPHEHARAAVAAPPRPEGARRPPSAATSVDEIAKVRGGASLVTCLCLAAVDCWVRLLLLLARRPRDGPPRPLLRLGCRLCRERRPRVSP